MRRARILLGHRIGRHDLAPLPVSVSTNVRQRPLFRLARKRYEPEFSMNGTGGSTNVRSEQGRTYIREYIEER
jgi:hypothetical protein